MLSSTKTSRKSFSSASVARRSLPSLPGNPCGPRSPGIPGGPCGPSGPCSPLAPSMPSLTCCAVSRAFSTRCMRFSSCCSLFTSSTKSFNCFVTRLYILTFNFDAVYSISDPGNIVDITSATVEVSELVSPINSTFQTASTPFILGSLLIEADGPKATGARPATSIEITSIIDATSASFWSAKRIDSAELIRAVIGRVRSF